MADGPIRRVIPKRIVFGGIAGDTIRVPVSGVSGEPGTIADSDRSADADDRNVNVESDSVKSVGVIDIDPGQLGNFIDQRSAAGSGDDSNGGRTRRKRSPNGTRRGRSSTKETAQNIDAVTAGLNMLHTWGAALLHIPELEIEQDELQKLSESYGNFAQYHEAPMLTPKRVSEINLAMAVVTVYGTRFMAWRRRKAEEKKIHSVGNAPQQSRQVQQHPVN